VRLRKPGVTDLTLMTTIVLTDGIPQIRFWDDDEEDDAMEYIRKIKEPGAAYVSRVTWNGELKLASVKYQASSITRACPKCNAPVGAGCKKPNGDPTALHRMR
jgi:hypothetical protein